MIPRASILIPLKRQHDAWLEQCVRSAIQQTEPCETIVVHSADTPAGNLTVLERIAREGGPLRILLEEKPGSFPAAINLGIREASADRIGFLLSDDWLEPDAVEHCLPVNADLVSTGHTTYFEDGRTVHEAASNTPSMAAFLGLKSTEAKAAYLEHFFLFRRSSLLAAGGLDETIGNFPGIDDYDLIWTLLERGAIVGIVEKRLYNYRDHDGERLTLADRDQACRNLAKILRKHGIPEPEIDPMVEATSKWFGVPIYKAIKS